MTATSPAKRTVRPPVLDKPATKLVDRGHIRTSAEFREFVAQQKVEAERRKEDYLTEIAQFEIEIARGQKDQDTRAARCDAEIRSRMNLIVDEDEIISGANAMLAIDGTANRPAPKLTAHAEPIQNDLSPQLNAEPQT